MPLSLTVSLALMYALLNGMLVWMYTDYRKEHGRLAARKLFLVAVLAQIATLFAPAGIWGLALTGLILGIVHWLKSQELALSPSWLYRQL